MDVFSFHGYATTAKVALKAYADWKYRPGEMIVCPVLYNDVSLDFVLEELRNDGADFAAATRELIDETRRVPRFCPPVLTVQFMADAADADAGTWAVSLDFYDAGSDLVGWDHFTMEKAALRPGCAPGTLRFEWSNMCAESVDHWEEHSIEVWTQ